MSHLYKQQIFIGQKDLEDHVSNPLSRPNNFSKDTMDIQDVGLMWWCPIDMAESKKIHFCVFQKQKQKHNKKKYIAINCMPFLKKSKSSQVNILILDFYLLEQSNYKRIKQNKTKKLMKKLVHKLKRKSKNLQVNCHEISQESNMMLISHHMLRTLLHPQNTKLKRKYLAFMS